MKYKTIAMEWIYKNIEIGINSEGRFFFNVRGKDFSTTSLDEAKEIISEILASYYTFTQKDMDKLLSKLDSREKELVKSLYQELENHISFDLFMKGEKREGWVNIYRYGDNNCTSNIIHKTFEDAYKNRNADGYITTTKIEWEE